MLHLVAAAHDHSMQDGDTSAAMSVLAPAWEALEEGMHKAPHGRAFPPSSPGSRTGKTLLHAGACHVYPDRTALTGITRILWVAEPLIQLTMCWA